MAEEIPANVNVVVANRRTFPRPFGRYILEKNLSRGGMGEVHLAYPRGANTRCVIKTIRGDLTGDKEFVGRFADEAKIMVRIAHDNIIRVFDCGKVGGDFYIAMEFVHGRDLGDVLDRAYERGEPMPKEHGLYLTKQILKGLDYAHNLTDELGRPMRLVHRDISPQNVLIGFDGSVKIIDFGLARTELLPARTQGALAVGKYGYMSPEQARHEKIDGRADLYSTGVMLFEVFTGDRLVDEQDQATLWARVLSPKHRRPTAVVPELPRDVDDLVMKAVEVRQEDRFPDAKAMLRYIDGMKTRSSDKAELIKYLRFLYPNADFSPPPMPDFTGVEAGEQSMIFAMSEDGAKSVFGRGELPVEWTRQVNLRDLEKERKRREEEKRKEKEKVKEPRTWDESSGPGGAEATVVGDERVADTAASLKAALDMDEPTSGGATEEAMPAGVLSDFQRTAYDKAVKLKSPDDDADATMARRPGFGEAAIREEHFRDEEATVMMSAPLPTWPGDASQDDVNAATRLIPGPPSDGTKPVVQVIPTAPPSARGRAIQERHSLPPPPKEAAPLERTLPPAGDKLTRKKGNLVVTRQTIGVQTAAPEEPSPSERTREVPQLPVNDQNRFWVMGFFAMGAAVIVLLILLIVK